MRMMVKALLFDSAREIEKLQALQIDWAGCLSLIHISEPTRR